MVSPIAGGLLSGLRRGLEARQERRIRRRELGERRSFEKMLRGEISEARQTEREEQREWQAGQAETRFTLQEEATVREEERKAKRFRDIFEKADLGETAGKHPVLATLAMGGDTGALMRLLSQRARDDLGEMQDFVVNWRQMSNEQFVDRARRMKPIMHRLRVPIRGPYGEADVEVMAKHLMRMGVQPEQLGEEGRKVIQRQEMAGLAKVGRRQTFLGALKPEKPTPSPEQKAEEQFRKEQRMEELYKAKEEDRSPAPAGGGPTAQTLATALRRMPNEQRVRMVRELGSAAARGDIEAKDILREMGL